MLHERSKCFPSRANPFFALFGDFYRLKPLQAIKSSIIDAQALYLSNILIFRIIFHGKPYRTCPVSVRINDFIRTQPSGKAFISNIINIIKCMRER